MAAQNFPRWKRDASWWFQTFFIFTPIWGRLPFWLIFFRWVETTNQDDKKLLQGFIYLSMSSFWFGMIIWKNHRFGRNLFPAGRQIFRASTTLCLCIFDWKWRNQLQNQWGATLFLASILSANQYRDTWKSVESTCNILASRNFISGRDVTQWQRW